MVIVIARTIQISNNVCDVTFRTVVEYLYFYILNCHVPPRPLLALHASETQPGYSVVSILLLIIKEEQFLMNMHGRYTRCNHVSFRPNHTIFTHNWKFAF